jgi:hypothetical protein
MVKSRTFSNIITRKPTEGESSLFDGFFVSIICEIMQTVHSVDDLKSFKMMLILERFNNSVSALGDRN